MIIGERINKRIAATHTSQAALAREIALTPQAVSKMVRGGTQDTAKLWQIARFLRTTPEYLTGETDDPTEGRLDDMRLPYHGPEPEPERQPQPDPDVVEIDHIDLRYGLGGTFVDGPVEVQKRRFSREWLREFTSAAPSSLFWTKGDGDSMEPTIRSGEVILVDRSQTAPRMADGIWAFAYGEVGMVKRLRPKPDGSIEIHSDNQLVRPEVAVDGELFVVGRVIAIVRKV